MLNVDEISTKPERVFTGKNNLIGGSANSLKQAATHVNAHILKGDTSGNDHIILFMDAVKN